MPLRKLEVWGLAVLALLHLGLGLYYSVAIPIWEAHDEIGHYYFARYLATERHLVPPGKRLVAQQDESRQPPLYYILAAVPMSLVNVRDGVEPYSNPYMWLGPASGGYNRVVHDEAIERWPYHGTVLAIHVARWVSVLLGALGLFLTFLIGRDLAPEQPWVRWGAALLITFWPLYRASTAVVNNDIMMAVSGALVTWLAVRCVVADQLRVLDPLALLLALGLALLSKNTGLALVPAVLVAVGAVVQRASPAQRRRLVACLGGGLPLGMAGAALWYARNAAAGRSVFGARLNVAWLLTQLAGTMRGQSEIDWRHVPIGLQKGVFSLWASFGWGNVGLPLFTYWVAGIWAVLGVAGLVLWLRRRPSRRELSAAGIIALVIVCIFGIALAKCLRKGDIAGRYLLPALPGLCVLLAVGWGQLLPQRFRAPGWAAIGGMLAILVVVTPGRYILPRYAPAPRLTEAQAAAYIPVHGTFGGFAELVGYRIDSQLLEPDGTLHLALAWRALARTEVDYTLAVQVFAQGRELLGEAHRFPGWGTYPTTSWEPGVLFVDEVAIPVESKDPGARPGWVEISFYEDLEGKALVPVEAYDAEGDPAGEGLFLTKVKVRGTGARVALPAVGVRFGPAIGLGSVQAHVGTGAEERGIRLGLSWVALGRPERDYTVSLQLRDKRDAIVAQVDSQPQNGEFPTTLWEVGDVVNDSYLLAGDVPDGSYTLYACVYDVTTMERLPAADLQGAALARGEVSLLTCSVADGRMRACRASYPWVSVSAP